MREEIGDNFLYADNNEVNNAALVELVLPESLEVIGKQAFERCSSLTALDLSRLPNLTSIKELVFYGCERLTTLPPSPLR